MRGEGVDETELGSGLRKRGTVKAHTKGPSTRLIPCAAQRISERICSGIFSSRMAREVRLIFRASKTVPHRSKSGSGSVMGRKSPIVLFFMLFLRNLPVHQDGVSRRLSDSPRDSDIIFSPSPSNIISASSSSPLMTVGI